MRGRWGVAALVAVVVLGAGLAQTSPGHDLLQRAGLFEAPTSYTELAFSTPDGLPEDLISKRASIPVSFGIHNASGAAQSYQWSVVLTANGHSRVSASGGVTVPAQGQVAVDKVVKASCNGGRLQVTVRLTAPAQSIDFWVDCP
jgi:hypothetical protein